MRLEYLERAISAPQDLIEMVGKGGLVVATFAEAGETGTGEFHLFRTVIQANGNIITWVDPEVENEQAWKRHYGKLQGQLQAIRHIRSLLNRNVTSSSVAIVAILNLLYQPLFQDMAPLQNADIRPLVFRLIRIVVSIGGVFVLHRLLRIVLRWIIRRQLDKYLPGVL